MLLPATVASATTAATTIATVPASATAAAATTSASSSSAATTAKASASPPATSAASALAGWPSFVDNYIPTHKIVAVESLNGALGFLVAINFDKTEPTRLT
jgi:hypothetical protein